MDRNSILFSERKIPGMLAGIFMWFLAGLLIFVDIPYALKNGIIHGVILSMFFVVILFSAGAYIFRSVWRGLKAKN